MTRILLDTELHELDAQIIQMGSLVENALPQVLETLETDDRDKADAVVVADNAIDDLHTPIKDCLYCGLQFSATTDFCSNCGRPTERGFKIRPIQESEFDRLRREVKEKDDMIRQQGFYSVCSGPLAHKDCLYCGLQFSATTDFCSNCGRPTERALRRLDPS